MAYRDVCHQRQRPSLDEILPADGVIDEVAVTSSSASPASISPQSPAAALPRFPVAANPFFEAPAPLALTPPANDVSPSQNYSVFTTAQKRFIVVMVTLAAFVSPLSAQIYYPVMPMLADTYGFNSMAPINLTITTYMLLQGLAPVILGPFSDACGRRLAYILSFMILTAANNGLALQESYAALMALRCLQSAGSSGTVSFGYGVIADISTPAERGSYTGTMAAGVMIAPALGPVIGGLIASFFGWRIVFLFLALLSGVFLAVYVLFVPETARRIVGDGSVVPKEWWRRPVVQWCTHRALPRTERVQGNGTSPSASTSTNARLHLFKPLSALSILLHADALILISTIGLLLFSNIAILTSTPYLFTVIYDLSTLQIGLCFLPLGVGASLGAIITGKILDWNYRRHASALSLPLDTNRTTDLRDFPIEHARLQAFFPAILLCLATIIPYGFALQASAHIFVPLVLQFFNGFATISATNALNTLLVDLFPDRPATAAAACNLVRCWLGALGAAVVENMLRDMGLGWCFVFLGAVFGLGGVMGWVEYVFGRGWREKRAAGIDESEKKRNERTATAAGAGGTRRSVSF
ncbi:major facilitator superfamily domain-containing protein [Aspergillus pseudodeflectus]|uniref:Major facilitator superfamily domain-containing protein n=1 Tax=Aspergillus pseudodeflectus TaxID=176178 RepID=A0ABR4JLJ8_9EURO